MNISADLTYSFDIFEPLNTYARRREVPQDDQPNRREGDAQWPFRGVSFAPDF
jgi:hypothetical protein